MSLKYLMKQIVKIPFFARLIRHKFHPIDFFADEKLYHGFRDSDLSPDTRKLNVNTIRFPDFSCNWSRFSQPEDVKRRQNGLQTDGCYSFTVAVARYNGMATTCHDPLPSTDPKNYAHVEVRQLKPDEGIFFEPKKERELTKKEEGWSKSQRLAYRTNMTLHLLREIEPTD